ncbi:MAG: hypothetical protein AAGJ81_09475 [Verrucomicrobiota bacterium]
MHWWILEDALRDSKGHWCEYIETFRDGLSKCDDCFEIFCAGDATPEIQARFSTKPKLPPSIWAQMGDASPKWKRLLRVFTHGNATYKSVYRLLDEADSTPDVLFVPTVLVHHLWGWWKLLAGPLTNNSAKVLLFFPNTPIFIDLDGASRLNRDPTARIFYWLIRRLRKYVQSGQLVLGAETYAMVDALTKATGVPFTYFPHPVRLKQTPPVKEIQNTKNKEQETLVLGAFGAARFEKGSELIQMAAKKILKSQPDLPVEFHLQWLDDFKNEQGQLQSKSPYLEKHAKFNYITELFRGNGYHEQLAKTDIMLLPYRDAYQLRVSRVVIEAMLYGIPVITTESTTLWEQTERYGAALPCKLDREGKHLAAAIEQAIKQYPKLAERAQEMIHSASEHFSAYNFREILIQEGNLQLSA